MRDFVFCLDYRFSNEAGVEQTVLRSYIVFSLDRKKKGNKRIYLDFFFGFRLLDIILMMMMMMMMRIISVNREHQAGEHIMMLFYFSYFLPLLINRVLRNDLM
jgi:hypothetical protein